MKYKFQESKDTNPFAKKVLKYVQKVVIDTYFGGYLETHSVKDIV